MSTEPGQPDGYAAATTVLLNAEEAEKAAAKETEKMAVAAAESGATSDTQDLPPLRMHATKDVHDKRLSASSATSGGVRSEEAVSAAAQAGQFHIPPNLTKVLMRHKQHQRTGSGNVGRLQGTASPLSSRSRSRSHSPSAAQAQAHASKASSVAGTAAAGTITTTATTAANTTSSTAANAAAFDGNSSISSLDEVLDLDILTDRAGFEDLNLSETQRKMHASREGFTDITTLPSVNERMTDDALEDVHAFSDVVVERVCSSSNSIGSGSGLGGGGGTTGGGGGASVLEPLDEEYDDDFDSDEDENGNGKPSSSPSGSDHVGAGGEEAQEEQQVIVTNLENLTIQDPSSRREQHDDETPATPGA